LCGYNNKRFIFIEDFFEYKFLAT